MIDTSRLPLPPSRPAVVAALAVLVVVWGSTWAAIRIGLEGIPPFAGVALRFGIASAVLLGAALAFGIPLGHTAVERRLWLVNGLFSFVLSYGVVYWAEQWVPSGLAAILFATFPLFVAGLAHWVLPEERLTLRTTAGMIAGFFGVVVIFSEDLSALAGAGAGRAALVFLLSPLAAAIGSLAVKRWGRGIHPVSISAVPMGMCAGVMGAAWFAFERERELVLDPVSIGAVLYLAVLGSALTFSLYFWLLQHLPATRVSLVTYGSPIVAVLVGTLLLDEPFTLTMALGAALVIVGVVVTVRDPNRRRAAVRPTPGPDLDAG